MMVITIMMAHFIKLVSGDNCAMAMMIFVRKIHEISMVVMIFVRIIHEISR